MGTIRTQWKELIAWEDGTHRFLFDYFFDGTKGHLHLPTELTWQRSLPTHLHGLFHQVSNEMTAWSLSKQDTITQDETGVVYLDPNNY